MNALEAIALLRGVNLDEALAARHLLLEIHATLADESTLAAAAIWNAGRVQGIREERKRNKQRAKEREQREKYGYVASARYSSRFGETPEGWKLYRQCRDKAAEAMAPFYKAQAAWEAAQDR